MGAWRLMSWARLDENNWNITANIDINKAYFPSFNHYWESNYSLPWDVALDV